MSLGTSSRRASSVMVPTMTRVFVVGACFSEVPREASCVRRERERGGRLMRDMNRRRRTTLLKAESVRPVFVDCVSRLAAVGYRLVRAMKMCGQGIGTYGLESGKA